jgi:hypothetical protein
LDKNVFELVSDRLCLFSLINTGELVLDTELSLNLDEHDEKLANSSLSVSSFRI